MSQSYEPPEEPKDRSEPNLLSPVSPKPLHFPQPTNIPVLEMQMDVGFNQTEAHMNDPAMHDTEVRPNAWRDPNEQQPEADNAVSFSTGDDGPRIPETSCKTQNPDHSEIEPVTASNHPASLDSQTQSVSHFNGVSHDANNELPSGNAPDPSTDVPQSSSDPSMPSAASASTADAVPVEIPNAVESSHVQPATGAGEVDVQALLDNLQSSIAPTFTSPAPANEDVKPASALPEFDAVVSPTSSAEASSTLPAGLGAPPSGLPPRPPPQEQPLIHPDYKHSQHIRDYHPHAAHPAFQPHARTNSTGNVPDPNTSNFVPPVHSSSVNPSDASGYGAQFSVPATPSSSTHDPSFTAQHQLTYNPSAAKHAQPSIKPEDKPWTADVQRKYDQFMEEERRYVNEARWDAFPADSRLFVGNLSSEKVTKRDIFHVFHSYGDLAQISIKQAYGFVQFLRADDCARALVGEEGRQIRDKRIHLEVSKPQKPRRNDNAGRRSRSPDYNQRDRRAGTTDRYSTSSRNSFDRNGRDEYRRGYRSPSPRRDYRDRYDDRRGRSRSPNNRGGYGRGPARVDDGDNLPLPRRAPHEVPDVQILATGHLDAQFIGWVETSFQGLGLRVNTIRLSHVLNEDAVVKRQMTEGVFAVIKLKQHNQASARIDVTLFKRQGYSGELNFENYSDLEVATAAAFILQEKNKQKGPPVAAPYGGHQGYGGPPQPAQPAYQQPPQPQNYPPHLGYPPPGYPPQGFPPAPPGYPQQPYTPSAAPPYSANPPPNSGPNINPNLQNLLSTLNQSAPNTSHAAGSAQYATHAAAGYGAPPVQTPTSAQQYGAPPPGYPGQAPPATPSSATQVSSGQAPPNMQEILARLGTNYR